VTPVRNISGNAGASHAAARQGRAPGAGTNTTATGSTTPGRTAVTPARRFSAGTPGRGTTTAGARANTASSAARNAATPDRGTAALSRATPVHASGTGAARPGLVASPYQRRTSYGNGPGSAPGTNVARRLNLNPAPASSENNPGAAYAQPFVAPAPEPKNRRNVSATGAQGSPYVRRNAPGGSRIAIDRVEKTPLGSFSSRCNVPQESATTTRTDPASPRTSILPTPQSPTQLASNRRLTALESFRNSRRISDPKNIIPSTTESASKDPPLLELSAAVATDPEPTGDTLLSRMGAIRGQTQRSEDSKSMPDRQEEPFGFRAAPVRTMVDSGRSGSLPSSPTVAKRKLSDRFAEGSISAERVERMSLSLNRRRSRGQSGGPSDFPDETPTLTVAVQHAH
jgi:hypothetical protein